MEQLLIQPTQKASTLKLDRYSRPLTTCKVSFYNPEGRAAFITKLVYSPFQKCINSDNWITTASSAVLDEIHSRCSLFGFPTGLLIFLQLQYTSMLQRCRPHSVVWIISCIPSRCLVSRTGRNLTLFPTALNYLKTCKFFAAVSSFPFPLQLIYTTRSFMTVHMKKLRFDCSQNMIDENPFSMPFLPIAVCNFLWTG